MVNQCRATGNLHFQCVKFGYATHQIQLLSMLLNVGVYGVLCAQTCGCFKSRHYIRGLTLLWCLNYTDLYHLSFPEDTTRTKTLVYVTFVLETLQTLLSTKTIFDAFVYGFLAPNLSSLDHIGNLWFAVPILGGSG